MDTLFEVLKWVGIVLAAGFVGYLGRYIAMLIIDRIRQKKPQPGAAPEPPASQDMRLEESKLKLEKKRAKADAKRAKKAGKK